MDKRGILNFFRPTLQKVIITLILVIIFVPFIRIYTGIKCTTMSCVPGVTKSIVMAYLTKGATFLDIYYSSLIAGIIVSYLLACIVKLVWPGKSNVTKKCMNQKWWILISVLIVLVIVSIIVGCYLYAVNGCHNLQDLGRSNSYIRISKNVKCTQYDQHPIKSAVSCLLVYNLIYKGYICNRNPDPTVFNRLEICDVCKKYHSIYPLSDFEECYEKGSNPFTHCNPFGENVTVNKQGKELICCTPIDAGFSPLR